MNVWWMGGGGRREGERVRDKERLVLTPVIALMYDLIWLVSLWCLFRRRMEAR